KIDWIEVDLDSIKTESTIIHLAARAGLENDINILSNNLKCDLEVAEFAIKYGHRVVYVSTNNVYKKQINCTIGDEIRSRKEPYGLSKYLGECLFSYLPDEKYVILRLADVFGFGQKHSNFFKAIEKTILGEGSFKFTDRGDKLRSYIYIDEMISLLDHVININIFDGGIYNICHRESCSLVDIYYAIFNETPEFNEGQLTSSYDYRTMKQSQCFGYQYRYSLSDALNHYHSRCRKNRTL
ncbi:TPA: SDR family oxidoreductase, partial [Vibrio cholerae]|nr:SDR family oxidoreductase [Vibrio cholerae]